MIGPSHDGWKWLSVALRLKGVVSKFEEGRGKLSIEAFWASCDGDRVSINHLLSDSQGILTI